jgi:signal peptidase I
VAERTTGRSRLKLSLAATAMLATCLIATASSTTSDSSPTNADGSKIVERLAEIGIHVRHGDQIFGVPSASMEPTLHCAHPGERCLSATTDLVIARPYGSVTPARGDVVAFRTPPGALVACGAGGVFLKRLIGLPGDIWAEKDGYVYINGKKLNEPYVRTRYRDLFTYPPRTIPSGDYFVMGDNRSGSCDSRKWGTVPRRNIIGKLIAIFWPLDRVRRL